MMLLNSVTEAHIPTATDFPSSSSSLATLRHLSRCFFVNITLGIELEKASTYTFEYVLIDTLVAERLQMLLEPRRLACARASTEDDQLEIMLFSECYA